MTGPMWRKFLTKIVEKLLLHHQQSTVEALNVDRRENLVWVLISYIGVLQVKCLVKFKEGGLCD